MLVIEKMKAKENFTNLEQQITDYILEHPRDMMSLSLKNASFHNFSHRMIAVNKTDIR